MQQYNRRTLELMGVHELRKIGRKVGISAPTTMKKDALINGILNFLDGQITFKQRTNRGRPPKDVHGGAYEFDIYNSPSINADTNYVYSNESLSLHNNTFTDKFSLSDVNLDCEYNSNSSEFTFETKSGVLDVLPDGYGFLRANKVNQSRSDCYVSMAVIKKYAFKPGDFVVGRANTSRADKFPSLVAVETINGCLPQTARERVDFDNLEVNIQKAKLPLDLNCNDVQYNNLIRTIDLFAPLAAGQRVILTTPNSVDLENIFLALAKSVATLNDDTEVLYVATCKSPEIMVTINNDFQAISDRVTCYVTQFDDTMETVIKSVDFAIKRAKRIVESGKKAVIIVDELCELIKCVNRRKLESSKWFSDVTPTALMAPKQIFASARSIKNGASLTVVMGYKKSMPDEIAKVLENEIGNLSNVKIQLDDASDCDSYIVDFKNIYAPTAKILYNTDDMNKILKLKSTLKNMSNQEINNYLAKKFAEFADNKTMLDN